MKKKILRIVTFALALALLPGCARSQTQPTSASINQEMLLEKSAQEQEVYSFPEKFTGDWTAQEGKITIHADAQVVAEQGVILPTATVIPRAFDQEDVDHLLGVLLKGEPLYGYVFTKQELQTFIDEVRSPEWKHGSDDPDQSPERLEKRRNELIAHYTAEMAKAPEEKPIVHGFNDSADPNVVSGFATVDGVRYEVDIQNDIGGSGTAANFIQRDYKYWEKDDWGGISKEAAIAQADALMQELGLDNMKLDDVQMRQGEGYPWELYYTPTVNGVRLSSTREDHIGPGGERSYQYWDHTCSDEINPDTVYWGRESVRITVGKDGILSFTWTSPSEEAVVKEFQTALMPFDEIASIANTMLPVVIIGPSEAHSLVELDEVNGFETHMDVEITKVSLSLMRIRDKGSLQGTVVPVWDFWGTTEWYDIEGNVPGLEKGTSYRTQPLLTLNAIDGNVVSRLFGY